MGNARINIHSNDEISSSSILRAIPVASVVATAANVAFFYLVTRFFGEPLLFPEQSPPPETSPMPVTDVIIFSIIFSIGAGMVFLVIARLRGRPVRLFLVVSTIVLLISFALPLRIPTPPVTITAKLVLVMMHIIGGVAVVGMLIGFSSRSELR